MQVLSYQSVTKLDDHIFSIYELEEERRHDMIFLTKSGLNEALKNGLIINGDQYYIYGDDANVI